LPFAVMASLAVILVVLWDRSPFVAVVLVGPLLATALYQRWIHGALDRLREFDRLKDEFIAIVSHELRTPLTSVYGAAMTLEKHELDDKRRTELLEIISTEAARLSRLLDDILWVSRLDSGRARPLHHGGRGAAARRGRRRRDAHASSARAVAGARARRAAPRRRGGLRQAAPGARQPVEKRRQVLADRADPGPARSHYGNVRFSVRDEGPGSHWPSRSGSSRSSIASIRT
jgi:signal transduction histidine kinase